MHSSINWCDTSVLHLLDARDAAAFIEPDFHLREIQLEGAGFEARAPEALGQFVRGMQHLLDRPGGLALEDGERLLIREPTLRMNHGGIEFRIEYAALGRQEKLDAPGQAIHGGLERAELVAQRLRQHRNDAIHEVRRVPAPARLDIERAAGLHVMRHIRDVHPQPPAIRPRPLQTNGIVEILRVVRIDRDDPVTTAIHAPLAIAWRDGRPQAARLLQDGFGELQREVVLAQHREHVHPFGVRGAEDLNDLAFGVRMARLPFAQFDHHLVPDLRGPADIARRHHVDIVGNPRVVGHDVEKLPAALERADHLRAATFQDADHRPGGGRGRLRSQSLRTHIASHEHVVLVQGGGGRAFGNDDFLEVRIVGLQKTLALAVHANPPGNEVRRARLDIAIALDAGDAAGLLQLTQDALQLGQAVGRQAQSPQELRDV